MTERESVFRNLDLSPSRNENETYEEYKHRQKCNNHIIKQYMKLGGEIIATAFPQGIEYSDIFQTKQEIELAPQSKEAYIPTPNEVKDESNS